mmetsp:Transcript_1220/g.2227  ORF Transcript_1220/g.2227 Transcript_1220/m.2227 type:complete len:674 (+) Transcript_1220:1064-3085(+)
MDVLIVIGTTSAWLYGTILLIFGYGKYDDMDTFHTQVHSHAHNFETASVIITIVQVGKLIESYSKMKTVEKLSELASLKVTQANLVEERDLDKLNLNCKVKVIQVELLEKNDFVLVQPGGQVPTDGVVIFGRGCCNESMLTGESLPVQKDIGVGVFGGTVLTQGSIIIKVTKAAEDATFNQIMKLVENAQNTKAPIQGVADKISSYFVPTIVTLAILDWIIWFIVVYTDSDESILPSSQHMKRFQFAFDFGISTLVIACPCALGLATPTAVMVGTGMAASYGILIKGADILEKIKNIDTIVFDKTGTLTSGNMLVNEVINCKNRFNLEKAKEDNEMLYEVVYLTEMNSEHPIGQSICNKIREEIPNLSEEGLNQKYNLTNFENINGEGVSVNIEYRSSDEFIRVQCGNLKLMKRFGVFTDYPEAERQIRFIEEEGMTVVVLAIDRVPQLIFTLNEKHLCKPEAKFVVDYFQNKLDLKVCMITGDNEFAAKKVAEHLGIPLTNVTFSAYPDTKRRMVQKYQEEGSCVMFVGDGINDSPVLAQSDIGVAINAASDLTVGAAGIVLMRDSLVDVWKAILIAKKTFQRIKINFMFAFVYNVLLIPVAMGLFYPFNGFRLDPMFAAVAMAASSISVVSSSLFLKLYKPKTSHFIEVNGKESQVGDNTELTNYVSYEMK